MRPFWKLSSWTRVNGGNESNLCNLELFQLIEKLLLLQLAFKHKHLDEIGPILLINNLAAGYIHGFQNACFDIHRLDNPKNIAADRGLIRENYRRMFGHQAGSTLYTSSLRRRRDHDFQIGWQSGYENFADYHAENAPRFGLQRIISLGFDASMVERTLNNPPRVDRRVNTAKSVNRTANGRTTRV